MLLNKTNCILGIGQSFRARVKTTLGSVNIIKSSKVSELTEINVTSVLCVLKAIFYQVSTQ